MFSHITQSSSVLHSSLEVSINIQKTRSYRVSFRDRVKFLIGTYSDSYYHTTNPKFKFWLFFVLISLRRWLGCDKEVMLGCDCLTTGLKLILILALFHLVTCMQLIHYVFQLYKGSSGAFL